MFCIRKLIIAVTVFYVVAFPVQAQTVSPDSMTHARNIANVCPNAWDSEACLKAVSESNLVMVSNYGAVLQEKKLEAQAETLKQHCAASTAAREQVYPAYAMKSAFTECANIISDLVDQTKIRPDVDHYQLLVVPVLCLSQDARCVPLEKALLQYKTL